MSLKSNLHISKKPARVMALTGIGSTEEQRIASRSPVQGSGSNRSSRESTEPLVWLVSLVAPMRAARPSRQTRKDGSTVCLCCWASNATAPLIQSSTCHHNNCAPAAALGRRGWLAAAVRLPSLSLLTSSSLPPLAPSCSSYPSCLLHRTRRHQRRIRFTNKGAHPVGRDGNTKSNFVGLLRVTTVPVSCYLSLVLLCVVAGIVPRTHCTPKVVGWGPTTVHFPSIESSTQRLSKLVVWPVASLFFSWLDDRSPIRTFA